MIFPTKPTMFKKLEKVLRRAVTVLNNHISVKDKRYTTHYALTDKVDRSADEGLMLFSGLTANGGDFYIFVVFEDAQRWANGESIEDCFPYLSANDRGILMSGVDSDGSWIKYLWEIVKGKS